MDTWRKHRDLRQIASEKSLHHQSLKGANEEHSRRPHIQPGRKVTLIHRCLQPSENPQPVLLQQQSDTGLDRRLLGPLQFMKQYAGNTRMGDHIGSVRQEDRLQTVHRPPTGPLAGQVKLHKQTPMNLVDDRHPECFFGVEMAKHRPLGNAHPGRQCSGADVAWAAGGRQFDCRVNQFTLALPRGKSWRHGSYK